MRWDDATFGWPEQVVTDQGALLRIKVKVWFTTVVVVVMAHWSGAIAVALGHMPVKPGFGGCFHGQVSGEANEKLWAWVLERLRL